MPNPRPNFGQEKIKHLISHSNAYLDQYGMSELLSTISATLVSYLQENESLYEAEPALYTKMTSFINRVASNSTGGVKSASPSDFPEFEQFSKNRSSIRNFTNAVVNDELVRRAIDIAKYAPSVCNRQGWRVHLYSETSQVRKLLRLQDGNGGFGETINKLLIVTADSRCFTNLESNQLFIDGGLFSMNLLLSLHSLGIGSCCLNLCVPYIKEKQIKKEAGIEGAERLIMMIGVGYFSPETKVAISARKDSKQILRIHSSSRCNTLERCI